MGLTRVHVFFAWPGQHLLSTITDQLSNMRLAPKSPRSDDCILTICNLVRCSNIQILEDGRVMLEALTEGMFMKHILEPSDYLLVRYESGNLISSSPRLCYDCGRLADSIGIDLNHHSVSLDEMFVCPHCFNSWNTPVPTDSDIIMQHYHRKCWRLPTILGWVAGMTNAVTLPPPPLWSLPSPETT